MKILIDLDADTAARLNQVAPPRSRRRSDFVRDAIRKALWDLEELETARAYEQNPDSADDVYLDPRMWEGVEAKQKP